MLATGAILLATTHLPELVQLDFGYTATCCLRSPGGPVTMAMMFIVGRSTRSTKISDAAGR